MTSYAVSRGHPAPLVGKRLLADGLSVYFGLDSYLVYIHFAHTQHHDYILYLCGGTSGIVWTVRFSLLSSKKMQNEENWLNAFSCKQWAGVDLGGIPLSRAPQILRRNTRFAGTVIRPDYQLLPRFGDPILGLAPLD